MHPVSEYRAEVAALKAELAELKARLHVVAPEATRQPGLPSGWSVDPCSVTRDAQGRVRAFGGSAEYEAWEAKAKADAEAAEAAKIAASTAGLPDGLYRDYAGMVRRIDNGKLASLSDHEDMERAGVQQQQAIDHRQWKQQQRLPVRLTRAVEDDDEATATPLTPSGETP